MKFKLERIEEIVAALTEIGKIDIISDTSCRLSAFMDRIDAAYKPYSKTLGKLRDKYGKWKYRYLKETVVDNKPKVDLLILTLQGPEKGKCWVNSKGEKEEVGAVDPEKTFWVPNSEEDHVSFSKEMEKLKNMEFEIKLKPIPLSTLVFLSGGIETKLNLKAGILSALKGIILNDLNKEDEAATDNIKDLEEALEKMLDTFNESPEKEEAAA
ncbi:MAG: hypothetical protein ACM34K_17760 [Bacillota bacterium]